MHLAGCPIWPPWIFAATVVPYVAVMFLGLQLLGARIEWRFEATNGEDLLLDVHLYTSALPPFSKYTVFTDISQMESSAFINTPS